MTFIKWPDIQSFAHTRKSLQIMHGDAPDAGYLDAVSYRPKIKLHGTNAALQVTADGELLAQSRSKIITPNDDNCGFAAWTHKHAAALKQWLPAGFTVFGEWFGKGVNKGAASCQVPNKNFAVFTAVDPEGSWIVQPSRINEVLGELTLDNVHVIEWYGDLLKVDWHEPKPAADRIATMVDEVERCDPWIEEKFDIKGVGEGLVFYPDVIATTHDRLSTLIFKAKGEEHKVQQTKAKVPVDPEVSASVKEFVLSFVTKARMLQAITETGARTVKDTGLILKWMSEDVQKESGPELEASGLTWKAVARDVSAASRQLWFEYLETP